MRRLTVFLIVAGAFYLIPAMAGGQAVGTSTCVDNACNVVVSSSPESMILAIGLALFVVIYPQGANTVDNTRVVGVWRRFGAFVLDYAAILAATVPLAALPALLAEARDTGHFRWSFARTFERPDDWNNFLIPGVAIFIILFAYFYLHARIGRQTLGQYVLGYRVVRADQAGPSPAYALRVILSFLGLCWWPISVIFALFKPDKAFWWDALTGTRVVRVLQQDPPGAQ